jgi:hypothetical protein
MRDFMAQRIYQVARAYEDGNDANTLRRDAVFKLGLDCKPLVEAMDLASAPTSPVWRMRPRVAMPIAWPGSSSSTSSPATRRRRR